MAENGSHSTTATATVLNTCELVDLIFSKLDRTSIHRCERVCKIFRSVIDDSFLIGQNMTGVLPIRRAEIKALTTSEIADVITIINAGGSWRATYVLDTLLQGVSFTDSHNFRYQLVDSASFDEVPRYPRPLKFKINPRLKPKSGFSSVTGCRKGPQLNICDVRGTTVELQLPDMRDIDQSGRVCVYAPEHYVTDPPITTVKMELGGAIGKGDIEYLVHNPAGLRLWDLVNTYEGMVKTLKKYGGSCSVGEYSHRCVALFVHDTLPARLRDVGMYGLGDGSLYP
ncbi:hypothetical protein LTR08_001666 [Meristemomyces frigidus]|nr:hypothetical protein LTR08_001666 [Meristemomyces frigidus]